MADISKLKPNGATGTEYNIIDDDYRNTDHTFTMNTYSSYSHTFEDTQISQRMPVRNVFTGIQSLFNSVKTAINDHGSLFGDIATALAFRVTKDNATYKALNFHSYDHTIDDSMELTTQFDGAGEMGCVWFTNTNLGVVTDAVNDHAEWIAKETSGSKTVTGNPLTITDAAGIKAEKIEIGFEPKQAGSGTPSPSNIRPITGYTSLSADGCGKNLFDKNSSEIVATSYLFDDGSIGTPATNWIISGWCPIIGGFPLTIYNQGSATAPAICWYDLDKNYIGGQAYNGVSSPITVTPQKDAAYVRFSCHKDYVNTAQLEIGSQATTYSAFTGNDKVTVQFNQTLYGGKLTILQDGSADVDVDTGFDVYDGSSDESWSRLGGSTVWGDYTMYTSLSGVKYTDGDIAPNFKTNYLNAIPFNPSWASYDGFISKNPDNDTLYTAIKSITTVANWRTYLASNPLQVAYPLATPFTLHLSPVETLTLLQGINNVWTDGATLSLTYQPDNVIGESKIYANEAAEIVAKEYTTESVTTDTDIYLYRASKNSGDRCYLRQLIGASFGVNQLVLNGNFEIGGGFGVDGGTAAYANNICTVTVTQLRVGQGIYTGSPYPSVVNGHKYLISYEAKFPRANVKCGAHIGSMTSYPEIISGSANVWGTYQLIINYDKTTGNYAIEQDINTQQSEFAINDQYQLKNFFAIDLTQMFGTAIADKAYTMEQTTAGSGIAWLKSQGHLTEDYYEYNTGSLQSVNTSGKVCGGKNLEDIVTNFNNMSVSGNQKDSVGCVAKNSVADSRSTLTCRLYYYNGSTSITSDSVTYSGSDISYTFTIPANTTKLVFGHSGATYNATVELPLNENIKVGGTYTISCHITSNSPSTVNGLVLDRIMIRKSTVSDATFEPYTTHTTDISPIDLRGVPKLVDNNIVYDGDIRDESGRIDRKYGIVDLGSLTWIYQSNYTRFYVPYSSMAAVNNDTLANAMCDSYKMVTANEVVSPNDKVIGLSVSKNIIIRDTAYTDAETFKVAMRGKYLVFPLATPTTEQTTPIQNPEIYSQFGWEQFIDDRSFPIPVGHSSEYVNLPDWMETGYVDDLRDRVDYDISKAIERLSNGNFSKNLLPMTVESVKRANRHATWNNNIYSNSGGNYGIELLTRDSVNINGIRVWNDGTLTGNNLWINLMLPGKYMNQFSGCILSGCNLNDTLKGYIQVRRYESPWTLYAMNTVGDTVIDEIPEDANVQVAIFIITDKVFDEVIYPMIRKQGEDNTYKLAMPTIQTLLNMYAELETRVKTLETS